MAAKDPTTDGNLIELEHVIGYVGRGNGGPICIPSQELGYAIALGSNVALCDVSDPHNQAFLKGHDNDVTAIDVSRGSRFVASGQGKSSIAPAGDSPVICWDLQTGKGLYNFFGIFQGVSNVKFSPDERLLAAAGADMSLFVWDLATGEQILGKHFGVDAPNGIAFLAWGPMFSSAVSKRPAYTLAFCVHEKVHVASIEYDFRVMRYAASIAVAGTPSTGFARKYTCGVIDPSGTMLAAGTTAGEVAIYQLRPTLLYKTALLASSNGVHSLTSSPANLLDGRAVLYVGGGDGSLRCFLGKDLAWMCSAETKMVGAVVSISLATSGSWLLAGTAAGRIHRISFGCDLRGGIPASYPGREGVKPVVDTVETSHTAAVLALAFHPTASDAIVTVSADTTVRLWDLNSYATSWSGVGHPIGVTPQVVWVAAPVGAGVVGNVCTPGLPCDVFAGFRDGTLRAFTVASGSTSAVGEAWKVNAHKGEVTSITGNRAVLITGGADGKVNVWSRSSHDLLLSFHDHSKPVSALAVDVSNPEVVYSAGADRLVHTYNLRAERRIKSHPLPPADTLATTITCLAQASHPSSENEVLAGTSDGRVFVFDPAIPDSHVGVTDILLLMVERERAGQAAAGEVPKAKPGQVRPDLRLVGIRMSPSGNVLAVATACGRVILLAPTLVKVVPPAYPRPTPTFTDMSGTVREQVRSSVATMRILAVLVNRCSFTDIKWAPDERQLVAVSTDGSITVLNWYGAGGA